MSLLPAAETENTVTYTAGSDFKGNCLTAIKLVHVDFNNSADKHLKIKSLKFEK